MFPGLSSPLYRCHRARRGAGAAMALSKLSGDEQCIIFVQLCNTLDPGVATRLVGAFRPFVIVVIAMSGPSRELGPSLGLMLRTSCLLLLVGDATGLVVLGAHRTIQGRPRVTARMEFGEAFYSAAVPLEPTAYRRSSHRPCSWN